MTGIVLLACVTLFLSFLCSVLEAALYSVTVPQLEVLKSRGTFGAGRFLHYRRNVEEPIAAILTVNTIAHTVGATWLGALVAARYDDAVVGIFTAVFTFAVLVLTEIVPKSVGVRYGQSLVPVLAVPLDILVYGSLPIARACSWLMRKMTGKGHAAPTEEEIIAMSRLAATGGELSSNEHRMMVNALLLDKQSAKDLLTPRTVVQTLARDTTIGEVRGMMHRIVHSRIPVTDGDDVDRVVGLVYRRDLFDALAAEEDSDARLVSEFQRPIGFVPETTKGPQLLEKFIRDKCHVVAVVDEYGGFEGIVTLEDVLEELLGIEIMDETDRHADMQEFARERARIRSARRDRVADGGGEAAGNGDAPAADRSGERA